MTNNLELYCLAVDRTDLGEVLRHGRPKNATRMFETRPRLLPRESLVVWADHIRRPCAIIVSNEWRQELYNWAVTFQTDLSPISSWCHVLAETDAHRLLSGKILADLSGFEATWAGAVIAEAMILSSRSFETLTASTCRATEAFALGRTAALYGAKAAFASAEQFKSIREPLRRGNPRQQQTSLPLEVLLRLLPGAPPSSSGLINLLVDACSSLNESGSLNHRTSTTNRNIIARIAAEFPPLTELSRVDEISAEQRVRFLREIRNLQSHAPRGDRDILAFSAGYVLSRVGGAERDLRLAESFNDVYPDVLLWATILGGLGANAYWTDAFEGMGRIISKELTRSFDFIDAPDADIGADEFFVLTEAEQTRPKYKFRTSQRNIAAISLRPGVNIQIPIAEDDRTRVKEARTREVPADSRADPSLQQLAIQLLPYLRPLLLSDELFNQSLKSRRDTKRTKPPELPLK